MPRKRDPFQMKASEILEMVRGQAEHIAIEPSIVPPRGPYIEATFEPEEPTVTVLPGECTNPEHKEMMDQLRQIPGQKFVMAIGPSGSGKSEAAKCVPPNFIVISTDQIRKGFRRYSPHDEPKVWSRARERACYNLQDGKSVWLDATNVSSRDRTDFLKRSVSPKMVKVAAVFNTPLSECLKRNSQRPRAEQVPPNVIKQQYSKFMGGLDQIPRQFTQMVITPRPRRRLGPSAR